MSHYTVAVITAKKENLEEMLAPYDENIIVEPYISKTKEELIEEGKEIRDRVLKKKEEGKEISEWDKKYIEAKTDEELYQARIYEDENYDEKRK